MQSSAAVPPIAGILPVEGGQYIPPFFVRQRDPGGTLTFGTTAGL
jgi:hypothetical protein